VNIHGSCGSRGHRRAKPQSLPEANTAAYKLALKWRDEWRAEKTATVAALTPTSVPRSHPNADDAKHRAKFAKGIARAELGRAYWDERLHRNANKRAKHPNSGASSTRAAVREKSK
jgi:hypothetical protein